MAKRGRPKLSIPSKDILTAWHVQTLSSPYMTTEKLRAYYDLWIKCGYSFIVLKRFLQEHLPYASRDEKVLRRYVKIAHAINTAVREVLQNSNPATRELVSREELELLIYHYLKKKLRMTVTEPSVGISEDFLGLHIVEEQRGDVK